MNKYIIWHVQGGLGKNVAATSLIPSLKEKYSDRKLVMVVSWPELFLQNKGIDTSRISLSDLYKYMIGEVGIEGTKNAIEQHHIQSFCFSQLR